MPGPYTGTPKGLFFYGSIQGAAAQGATTSAVWEAMQEAALNTAAALSGFIVGSAIPPVAVLQLAAGFLQGVNIQDVNQMSAIAGQNISAAKALAAAPAAYAIDSSMIGIPPAMGTGPGTGIDQKYSLRVNYTGIDEMGNEVTDWYTIYDVSSDTTVGDLRATAVADANARVSSNSFYDLSDISSINQVILNQV
jgi:hypothetical protein